MLSTVELLDRAKAAAGGCTDYRLAKLLEVPTQTVSNYRRGVSRPENPIAMRLADLCGLDPVEVVAWVNIERARSDSDRQLWEMVLARTAGKAGTTRRPKPNAVGIFSPNPLAGFSLT